MVLTSPKKRQLLWQSRSHKFDILNIVNVVMQLSLKKFWSIRFRITRKSWRNVPFYCMYTGVFSIVKSLTTHQCVIRRERVKMSSENVIKIDSWRNRITTKEDACMLWLGSCMTESCMYVTNESRRRHVCLTFSGRVIFAKTQ